ncbi:MAG: hypothetical protein JW822_06850 [Spirochaetales bacterium]|nr:hypothetical protein [Spirochaetales bacterium]
MDVNRKRPDWREYFMDFARQAAKRSDCIRSQVGAVIVNKRNKVRGTGYNNTPVGVESCLARKKCYRIEHNIASGTRYETCRSIHAEQNAIIQAGEDNCVGGAMYIFGHNQVCILCKRFIINAGIERVYLKRDHASEMIELDPQTWLTEL